MTDFILYLRKNGELQEYKTDQTLFNTIYGIIM